MKVRVVHNFIGKAKCKNQIKISQKAHFKSRYQERTNVRCVETIYQDILQKLLKGQLRFKGYSESRKKYLLDIEQKEFTVVYDPNTGELVTIFY